MLSLRSLPIRISVPALLLSIALAFTDDEDPVHQRGLPALEDIEAHEEILGELDAEETRLYRGYLGFLREHRPALDGPWSFGASKSVDMFRVTVEQAIFLARNGVVSADDGSAPVSD